MAQKPSAAATGGTLDSDAPPPPAQGTGSGSTDPSAVAARTDDYARRLFEAGRAAYGVCDYRQALDYFQRAYETSQRPALLYNVGQAADRLRLDEIALKAFRLYLEKDPNAANRRQVEERIRVLEGVVAARAAPAEQAPHPSHVVLPAGTAAPDGATRAAARDEPESDGLLSQWWFWTGTGAVVATAVIVALATTSQSRTREGAAVQGSNGMVISTLRLTP